LYSIPVITEGQGSRIYKELLYCAIVFCFIFVVLYL